METQTLFNMLVGVAGFLGVFVFQSITRQLSRLDDKVASVQRDYVHKDDYRNDMAEIKAMLKQIYEKLDHKVDKA